MKIAIQRVVPLGQAPVAAVAAWSHYIAWSREAGAALVPHAIEVYDLTTRSTRTVVMATDPEQVSGVQGDGTMMVYTEVNPTNENQSTWKIHLHSLSQGWDRVLASSSGGVPLPSVPQPAINGSCIAWSEPFGDVSKSFQTHVVIYDAIVGTGRFVSAAYPDSVSVDDGQVFFAADHGKGRDIFMTSCNGAGTVTALTSSGQASYPAAGNGLVVWQEPIQGDPKAIWVKNDHDPNATPVEVSNVQNQGNAVPGQGFVLWLDGYGQLALRDARARFPAIAVPEQDQVSISARWAVLGSTVVWVNAQGPSQQSYNLYVGTVSVPASS